MSASAQKTPSPQLSKIPRIALWIFCITFCLRLLALWQLSNTPYFAPTYGDMAFYHDWALRILHGEWTHGAYYGMPGYAWWLAGVYKLFGVHPFIPAFLQCVSEAFISVLIFKTAQTIFRQKPADENSLTTISFKNYADYPPEIIGIVAALGWAFFQPAASFSIVLMPTSFLVLAYWGCLLWVIRMRKNPPLWQWLLLGFTAGAVGTMIATILMLVPLFLFAALRRSWLGQMRLRRSLTAILLIIAGVFIGTAPCWIHNFFIAKQPVFLSAHDGVNFYIGNNARANGYPKMPEGLHASQAGMLHDSITVAERSEGHALTKSEVSRFWKAKADAFIHQHPLAWMKLLCVKFKNFWNAYQYDDLSLVALFSENGTIPFGIRFGLVSLMAIPGIFFAGWYFRRARWVVAGIGIQLLSLMPVFVTERYRLAAVPGLLLMGCAGLWLAWRWLVLKKWKPIVGYISLTVIAFFFVTLPPPQAAGFRALDQYNVGILILNSAHTKADLQQAQKKLEAAYAISPDNAAINFALGNLWLKNSEKGGFARSEYFYKNALKLDPGMERAWVNLGILAIKQKRWSLAEQRLQNALRIKPNDAKTLYLLAKTYFSEKKFPDSLTAIRRALKLKPADRDFLKLQNDLQLARKKLLNP